ncbi:MAG: Ca-activated chloride channel family protein [Crocinitomicaceae bacterium]|jgi:Ca-activated chloride channel family protein
MKVFCYIAFLVLSPMVIGQVDDSWRDTLDFAREAYEDEEYAEALKYYESAQKQAPDNVDLSDEMAQSAYRAREFKTAEKIYQQAESSKKNKAQKGDNQHNLGNSRMKQENYQGAIDAYKESLRNNPNDDRTRYNLSEAIRKLKQQQPPPPGGGGSGDPQDGGGDEGDPQQGQPGDQDGEGSDGDKSGQTPPQGGGSGGNGEPKDGEGQLSDQSVERALDKLARDEAETKSKMGGGTKGGKSAKSGKDW